MNNASKTKPVIDMSISDTTDDIIRIIKNSSNRALLSFKIGEKMKEFDVANKVSKEKVFKMYHRNVEAFSLNNLKEQLRRAKDPVYKIILRTAERIKEGKKVPSFPSELVYRWEDSDLNQSKSTI